MRSVGRRCVRCADEGSVSLENFQELFDLAGEALRLYDEVTFTRPVAGPAVELYLELAGDLGPRAMAGTIANSWRSSPTPRIPNRT